MIMRLAGPLLVLGTAAAHAQTAPTLRGRIFDSAGAPVAAARVAIEGTGAHSWSDATGNYQLRVPAPCECTLQVSRLGYAERRIHVSLRNGSVVSVDVVLTESSVALAPVTVVANALDRTVLNRDAIVRLHATTAADVLATVPQVIVIRTTPAGPQYVTLRGSTAGQVLVLVDGVAINDPVTGAADLSRVSADAIETIAVLPGARSAQYGARALAGVILITMRGAVRPRQLWVGVGSLRSYAAGLSWSDHPGAFAWSGAVHLRGTGGAFRYSLDDVAGEVSGTRANADATSLDAVASSEARVAGGTLSVQASRQHEDRGLPGKAYAPTPLARQKARLAQVNSAWRSATHALGLSYARQWIRIADPRPSFGLPYDDTIRLQELRAEVERLRAGRKHRVTGRLAGRRVSVDATTLTNEARAMAEASGALSVEWRPFDSRWFVLADVRADYNDRQRQVYGSHGLTIGRNGRVSAQLSHRSSYAPPSLADQFFRESIGIAANPDLRAERVPRELEAVLRWHSTAGPASAQVSVTGFVADTRDLIVWEPDYRFVWSPRNTDVGRRGGDINAQLTWGPLSLRGGFVHQRITYRDFPGNIQVAYRPRNTATAVLECNRPSWHARVSADYLGARNTAATQLNALPGFWTLSAAAARSLRIRRLSVDVSLRADRIFNRNESLIYGFPQPSMMSAEARFTLEER
jgi:outer membrane cobalamin receptor